MWVQMGFSRFRPNETFILAILLCLFWLERWLWPSSSEGFVGTSPVTVWLKHVEKMFEQHIWQWKIFGCHIRIYIYNINLFIYIYIYDYLFILVPIPPVWAIPSRSPKPATHAVVTEMPRAVFTAKSLRQRWWLLGGMRPKRLLLSRILLSAHWWRQSFVLGWGWDLHLLQMSLGDMWCHKNYSNLQKDRKT